MYINCAAIVYMYVAVTSGTRLEASTSGNVCRLHEVLPDCLIHRGGEEEEVLQKRIEQSTGICTHYTVL